MGNLPLNSLFSASNIDDTSTPIWSAASALAALAQGKPQSPALQGLNSLAGLKIPPANPVAPTWPYVVPRFTEFLSNIELTPIQIADGVTKYRGVISCLNWAYYGHGSETDNAFLIGSWAKGTRVRPPRDVDLYFLLPTSVYQRFESYRDSRQSALLQEVKGKLLSKYSNSNIKGDGPIVWAAFESFNIEVAPAFALTEQNAYFVCDTKNGGTYKRTRPWDESAAIEAADRRNAYNVRPLIRMLKVWQNWCSVPIKSFHLELLAIDYLDQCAWRSQSYFYYDWICRDFFSWMIRKANTYVTAPGTLDLLWLGDDWKTKAESAYKRASLACDFEMSGAMLQAGDAWQMIFGPDIPRSV